VSLQDRLSGLNNAEKDVGGEKSSPKPAIILDRLKQEFHRKLVDELGPELEKLQRNPDLLTDRVQKKLHQLLAQESTPLSLADKNDIISQVADDVLGYGPIEPFLRDPEVTEIMINNDSTIYIERFGKLYPTSGKFLDQKHLRQVIDKIVGEVGRHVDESTPMVDARLPDGSRVNAVIHPLALNGPVLTIRKFSRDPYMAEDLVEFGTMSSKIARFLEGCVRGKISIIVSGGTGTGKTTTLNVLSSFISNDERIITIEDAAELQLHQQHVVRLESRPPNIEGRGQVTIRDLVRNALRMRPDRIVVGEARGGEALDMLQAMNTGHEGSLTTVHANSPRDVLSRLETMVLMSGMDLPVRAIREQVASAIELIIHQARLKDGSRRITHISEVVGMEGDIITLQDLFLFDFSMGVDEAGRFKGRIKSTGLRPKFAQKLIDLGIVLPPEIFELEPMARR
jgi:pilus assembly protein CpaF